MSDKHIYWYVLFARTGAEDKLAEQLKNEFDKGSYFLFVPKREAIYRRKGVKSEFHQTCFPGYVFLESDKPAVEVIKDSRNVIYRHRGAYRFLNYGGNGADIAMHEEERLALSKLLGVNRSIDISKGFKEGDKIKVISGALLNNEGIIEEINTSQKTAIIKIPMFGTSTKITVGLELVEKGLYSERLSES